MSDPIPFAVFVGFLVAVGLSLLMTILAWGVVMSVVLRSFSLRSVFVVTTLISVILGLMVYFARK
jgi:hypothetical protein